jgi:hypothetical protein
LQVLATFFVSSLARGFPSRIHQFPLRQGRLKNQSLSIRLEKEPGSPLFLAAIGKTGKLSRRPLVRTDAADMLKRRLKQAELAAR